MQDNRSCEISRSCCHRSFLSYQIRNFLGTNGKHRPESVRLDYWQQLKPLTPGLCEKIWKLPRTQAEALHLFLFLVQSALQIFRRQQTCQVVHPDQFLPTVLRSSDTPATP